MGRKWTNEDFIAFLNVYENYDVLWNVESPQYRDRASRDASRKLLLEDLNFIGMDLDVEELRRKMKMIKTVYIKEVRKILLSRKSGDEAVYEPRLMWFKRADSFLGKGVYEHYEVGRGDAAPDRAEESEDSPNNCKKKRTTINGESCTPTLPEKGKVPTFTNIRRVAYMAPSRPDDELDHFGRYVTAMLRQLPPLNALQCQEQIQSMLTQERIAAMAQEPD